VLKALLNPNQPTKQPIPSIDKLKPLKDNERNEQHKNKIGSVQFDTLINQDSQTLTLRG